MYEFSQFFIGFVNFQTSNFSFLSKGFLFSFVLQKWHPDRWARNQAVAAEAKRRFQQIQEAYSGIVVTATAEFNAVNAFSFLHFF